MKRSDGFILEFDVHSMWYKNKSLPLLFISFSMKHDMHVKWHQNEICN